MFARQKLPAVSAPEVAEKREQGHDFVLLDVREPVELLRVSLGDGVELAPLSRLAAEGVEALPTAVRQNKDAEIVVICHHGNRSAQVAAWLRQQGWANVWNMTGGVDAYAAVDSTIGRY